MLVIFTLLLFRSVRLSFQIPPRVQLISNPSLQNFDYPDSFRDKSLFSTVGSLRFFSLTTGKRTSSIV